MPHSSFGRAIGGFKPIEHDVGEYLAELHSLARYLVQPPEDGADPVVTAPLTAGPGRDAEIPIWLHRVVSVEARYRMKRDEPGPVDRYLDCLAMGRPASPEPDLDGLEGDLSMRMGLLEQLSALPDNYLVALLLKEGKGLRVKGIAGVLGTTPASVRSVLYRARQTLRG